jgi:glutamine phosphoribosylpyrophosphate amidotransferase
MHASGVTWHNGRELIRVCSDDTVYELGIDIDDLVNRGDLRMIAHNRYSTSDLSVNQPLIDYSTSSLSIAHNGVIDQEDPSTWEDRYGFKCNTSNDSELILRAMLAGKDPLYSFPEASMAVVVIDDVGDVSAFRNTKRPMWISYFENGCVITSTRDIMIRASEGKVEPRKVSPFVRVDLNDYGNHNADLHTYYEGDLQ